jgi:hypothetical protein
MGGGGGRIGGSTIHSDFLGTRLGNGWRGDAVVGLRMGISFTCTYITTLRTCTLYVQYLLRSAYIASD